MRIITLLLQKIAERTFLYDSKKKQHALRQRTRAILNGDYYEAVARGVLI
ncbi:MAG: hypothetical protein IJT21_10210 [Synergistaceae bacterium]|nr:hypothetical protein [Synergistaceae bacterium]